MTVGDVIVAQADEIVAKSAWNAIADEHNQWHLLSLEEQASWQLAFARHRLAATPVQNRGEDEAGLRALRWLAAERTIDELFHGGNEWGSLTPDQRIEYMGKRKRAHDAAVLDARTAIRNMEARNG